MQLIDTHCHLDSETFQREIDDVIRRANDAGIVKMVTIGTTVESSQAAIVLSNQHAAISAVVGIHPNYTHEVKPGDWEKILDLAQHPRVVGIGETGLDKYWDDSPLEVQRDYFRRHLQLSRNAGKPFVVHCREAEPEVMEILREDFENGPLNGLMHAFCGDAEMAAECIEMGMSISFAGMVTFRKNDAMREVARTIPLDRLLVETDSPYLAPQAFRGKRNEPAYVKFTAECLAEVHGLSLEELAARTTANAMQIFGLA
ncbi:MAG: TatD family hydrolase [Planctomycetaceae bacterium]|nr:TatD family hydrolase [Planctomycetaceae bacterium]